MNSQDNQADMKLMKRKEEVALVERLIKWYRQQKTMLQEYFKETGHHYLAESLSRGLKLKANLHPDFMSWVRKKLAVEHTNSGVFLTDLELEDPCIDGLIDLVKNGSISAAIDILNKLDSAAETMNWDNQLTFARTSALRGQIYLKKVIPVPYDPVYRFLNNQASDEDMETIQEACKANLPHLENAYIAYSLARDRSQLYNHFPFAFRYESCVLNLERDLLNCNFWSGKLSQSKYIHELKKLKKNTDLLLNTSSSVDDSGMTKYIICENLMRLADSLKDQQLFWNSFTWASETEFMGKKEKDLENQIIETVKNDPEFHSAKCWIENPSSRFDYVQVTTQPPSGGSENLKYNILWSSTNSSEISVNSPTAPFRQNTICYT